jgi:hypothetical protein
MCRVIFQLVTVCVGITCEYSYSLTVQSVASLVSSFRFTQSPSFHCSVIESMHTNFTAISVPFASLSCRQLYSSHHYALLVTCAMYHAGHAAPFDTPKSPVYVAELSLLPDKAPVSLATRQCRMHDTLPTRYGDSFCHSCEGLNLPFTSANTILYFSRCVNSLPASCTICNTQLSQFGSIVTFISLYLVFLQY